MKWDDLAPVDQGIMELATDRKWPLLLTVLADLGASDVGDRMQAVVRRVRALLSEGEFS